MKKIFSNSSQLQCVFTDDGVGFYGPRQEVYFPYGSIENISMSLLGILQVNRRSLVCTFAPAGHGDRSELREMVKFARAAMKTAPEAEPQVMDAKSHKADDGLSPEEQLKQYKTMFVQGVISKEEYDAKKRLLRG